MQTKIYAFAGICAVVALGIAACTKKDEPTAAKQTVTATPATPTGKTPAAKTAATGQPAATQAKVIALQFHADWCGTCRALEPTVHAVRDAFKGKSVDFVVLDFTDKQTTAAAKQRASALGLGKVYQDHAPKTGYVLVVDASTKKVLSKLTQAQPRDEWTATLSKLIGA